jgi:hypothetical protein
MRKHVLHSKPHMVNKGSYLDRRLGASNSFQGRGLFVDVLLRYVAT